jgi:hypothetical protein
MKLLILTLGFLTILYGCADRRIIIRSEPEGAKVIVDSKEMGVTPCSFPFTYYGTREIILKKNGYQTMRILKQINAPFIHIFPFDVLILFVPYPLKDHRDFSYILVAYNKSDVKDILKRGDDLKKQLNKKFEK